MIELSDDQLVRLADLIADRLAERAAGELIDAAELARRIGRSREFVYDHAAVLGAVRLGDGERPRLAFRWPQVLEALTVRGDGEQSQVPGSAVSTGVVTNRPRRRMGTSTDLLPIGGSQQPQEVRRAG